MRTSLAITVAAVLAACGPGGGATLKGRVSDDTGTQKQGLSGSELGGSGSVSGTAKVRLMKLKADGTLELVADATVQSGGKYELTAPANEKKLIVQSIDASGKVRASAIVEQCGANGTTTAVAPMSTETSVEAEVLAQMLASGVTLAEANAIDVRARINAQTAEAVKASSDAAVRVKALAEACAAAQRAQLKAWAEAGVMTTQSAQFDAQLTAAAKLNAALDAAADAAAAEKAYEDFIAELHAKVKESAGDARKASKGERAASVAFRATVRARLQVNDAVADAAVRHAAGLEARLATQAAQAALTAGGAAQATVDSFEAASTQLHTQLRASASVAATVAAHASYQAALVGSGSVSGSVLGSYLEVNATTQAQVQTAVSATATAAASLDAALTAAATASITASQAIDFDAYAAACVAALKTFDAAVQTQSAALTAFGTKADVALELMAQANGSLRVMD